MYSREKKVSDIDVSPPDKVAIEDQIIAHQRKDAIIMLDFARRKAIDLPRNLIPDLLGGGLVESTADPKYAIFLDALGKLTKLIAPATPESIRYSREVNSRGVIKLRRLVGVYAGTGYLLFLLLFLCQGYWFLLNGLVENVSITSIALTPYADVQDAVQDQIEANTGKKASPDAIEAEARKFYDRAGEQILARQGMTKDAKTNEAQTNEKLLSGNDRNFLEISLVSDFAALNSFVGWTAPYIRDKSLEPQVAGQFYLFIIGLSELKNIQAAHMILDMLNRYVLPIIYGFLGAAIYLVRRLTVEIKAVSFTESMRPELVTRFFLGGVSGLVVAWFVAPDSSKTEALLHNTNVLSTLSPLALSFIAGYSIELVFSIIDRIVSAFTEKDAKT
jgi:hypothetical protein